MSKTKTQSPEQYFDLRASSYRSDLLSDPFLRYFHIQRLEAAIQGRPLSGKRLLDIGAGTGILYDYLMDAGIDTQYLACDVSKKMLEQSSIPRPQRFQGEAPDLFQDEAPFDGIFILGVSTYLSQNDIVKLLDFCCSKLNANGFIAISFTHRKSFDFWFRKWMKKLIPNRFKKGRVIGSTLSISAFTLKDVKALSADLNIEEVHWLNQTVPFLNRLLPKPAVYLAKIRKRILPSIFLPYFSSDFLVIFSTNK